LQRLESLLLTPATILGTPAEAGLNQKNSTSLTLGTQTAFDFYPKMLNGARKNLSNLVLNIVTYLWETTLAISFKKFWGGLKTFCSHRRPFWGSYLG
jgi:hypothetical protein